MLAHTSTLKSASGRLCTSSRSLGTRITYRRCAQTAQKSAEEQAAENAKLYDLEATVPNQFAKDCTYHL